jgi:hypothetical protein
LNDPLGAQLQPANLLLKFQPKTQMNQWFKTYPSFNQKPFSWELVVLTYHCRELLLLVYLQQEKDWGI